MESPPPSQISVGTAFFNEYEMQVTGSFWNLGFNINISNHGEIAQAALRDMEELVKATEVESEIRREIGNLQMMAEITRKINSMELILSGARFKRRLLSLGGRVMKYLFWTALTADITSLNNRIDEMDRTQGRLIST
jgi:hypothetical protein